MQIIDNSRKPVAGGGQCEYQVSGTSTVFVCFRSWAVVAVLLCCGQPSAAARRLQFYAHRHHHHRHSRRIIAVRGRASHSDDRYLLRRQHAAQQPQEGIVQVAAAVGRLEEPVRAGAAAGEHGKSTRRLICMQWIIVQSR